MAGVRSKEVNLQEYLTKNVAICRESGVYMIGSI